MIIAAKGHKMKPGPLLLLLLCPGPLAGQVTWTLSTKPRVQIGVAEGDPNHELFDARSSVRLTDGRIVVLNAGTAELRFYDGTGKFLFKSGRKGSGPGEFRVPARLYYTHQDSLLVFDQFQDRESHFDTSGKFTGTSNGALVATEMFKRDVWLYGRNYVDGPPIAAERSRIKAGLDRLGAIPPGQYRFVKVDSWYRLWVREARRPDERVQRWAVHDHAGTRVASLNVPAGFEIQQIGPDFLLGRSRDELDVEYIQLYALQGQTGVGRSYFTPAAARPYAAPPVEPALPAAALSPMRAFVRNLASQQEVHYSRKGSYTLDLSQLPLPTDKSVTPHMLDASDRGWAILVIHRDTEAMCAMTAGQGPVGWSPGRAICGQVPMSR
ncbi:MAG TPA: 6-bladed beta-propeller [Longimicrobiales bacterium]|nr:6-bladed beta-propeller [Longimicrobiales bacterium]